MKTINRYLIILTMFLSLATTLFAETGSTTDAVGSIPGSASVSPTGGANFQIPIEVPTGINGMQPQVAVVYNSQSGFGTLGMGWDIACGSAITCGGKNIYFDGRNDGIKLGITDALFLDGQRLILLSGTHFQVGAVYGTEVENYTRVKIAESPETWNRYFIVTTKDGKTMEYGGTFDSMLRSVDYTANGRSKWVLANKLNKVSDTYGNSITYTYTDNRQYLQKIEYAGQSVVFAYDHVMAVPKNSYIKNFLMCQTKLLSSITTKSGTTKLKTFSFNYIDATDDRLKDITETAPDNTFLKSTKINWGAESIITTQSVGNCGLPTLIKAGGSIYSGDVNGDGYADRIEMWPGNNKTLGNGDRDRGFIAVYLFHSNTGAFSDSYDAYLNFSYFTDAASDKAEKPMGGDTKAKIVVTDVNGDGKSEIAFANFNQLYLYSYNNTPNLQKQGNQLSLKDDQSNSYSIIDTKSKYSMFSANIDNDKYNDIIFVVNGTRYSYNGSNIGSSCGYICFKGSSDNSLTRTLPDQIVNNVYFDPTSYQIGDFNADGKMDIYGIHNRPDINSIFDGDVSIYADSYFQYAVGSRKKYTADFNGDGLSDILVQDGGYSWHLLLNNRFQIQKESTRQDLTILHNASDATEKGEKDDAIIIDYNGDGMVDVVIGDETFNSDGNFVRTTWYFYKNNKNGTFSFDTQSISYARMAYYQADVNGDGIVDLVISDKIDKGHYEWFYPCPENNGGGTVAQNAPSKQPECEPYQRWVSNFQQIFKAFTFPNANRRNTVTSVTNGMDQINGFTYKNFSAYQPFDASEASAKVRNLRTPILLVDTHTEPDGSVTTYNFEKPMVHTEGKGFMGFTTVTVTNPTKNAKITSEYEIEPTYFGANLKRQTITNALTPSSAVSSSTQTNAVIDNSKSIIDNANIIEYGKNGERRYIPIVTEQISIDGLKDTKQTNTIDFSLYPTSVTQTSKAGYSAIANTNIDLTTKVVTVFTGPDNCIIPYLPKSKTTTLTQQNEQSVTRTIEYYYEYGTGADKYQIRKSTETIDPLNTQFKATTEYSNPDIWGHMQTITVKAKDQNGTEKSRSSSISYIPVGSTTSSGRFIVSKTNALNETTNYDWNETLGLLNSETTKVVTNEGTKDRTTTYKYNNWGQLTETTYPTGMRTANVLQWNTDSSSKYFSYSETSGNAPLWVYYDKLGREVRKETMGLGDKKISVFTEYKTDGKLSRISEPTFNTTAETWASTYDYDPTYGYLSSVTTPVGTSSTVYDKLKTTVTTPEGTSETVTNAAGQTMNSKVNEKTVSFTYFPSGLTKTSTPEGGQALTMDYDLQGHRTYLKDPDAGEVFSTYNGFGELTEEKQKMRNITDFIITTNTYDDNGLLLNINRNGEQTTYTYDTTIKSRVNVIELKDKNSQVLNRQTFTYDPTYITDRVMTVKEEIGSGDLQSPTLKTYISGKDYDDFGRINKETFPSGYYTLNTYDKYSNLTEVKDNANRSIWKVNTENARGQLTSINKGAKETTFGFDSRGLPTSIVADGVENMSYLFDNKGNLESRIDNINNQQEYFEYDESNRLISWTPMNGKFGGLSNTITYSGIGNITAKSDLGNFTMSYGGNRPNGSPIGPHALATISGVPANFPIADLAVTYTDFKKIATLDEGTKHYNLTYGVDDQRRMSVYKVGGVTKLTRYYVGDYEEEVVGTNVRKIHYLSGAILIQNNGVDSLIYTYSDNQGSLIALTKENGDTIQTYAYDPWGARRNPNNWTSKDGRLKWIVNRGYTGHEHLDVFGIINMNGRVYDPLTAQFFSPDPYVQAPGNWVNYNRYGYCMGNPFAYTDPSGNNWRSNIFSAVAGIGITLAVGIATGGLGLVAAAAIGGASGGLWSNVMATGYNGGSVGDMALAGVKGMVIGGVAGFAGGSAAQGMTNIVGTSFGGFAAGAAIGAAGGAAGGFAGGALGSWMNGGSFGDGLIAGLQGAGIGAVAGGLIGGTIKGIDAAVNGKANFWDGHVDLDLSKGYGASSIKAAIINKIVKGTYIRKFEGERVYESADLGTFADSKALLSGGITLPEYGITVGDGVLSRNYDAQLLKHEFGHILEYRIIHYSTSDYYSKIGYDSMRFGKDFNRYGWTETWANYLSNDYFSHLYNQTNWNTFRFPIQDISPFDFESQFGYPKPY